MEETDPDMTNRRLHPGAWWLWALFLAAAASRTTDLLLLALVCAVAWYMVIARGGEGSRGLFRIYLIVAVFVLSLRMAFRLVLGGGSGGEILFTLPQLTLPEWAVGIRIGGPVTMAEITGGLADGARLATLIVCVGAANALADPRRLLRSLPLALHAVGTAVVVAVGLVPQLVASALRIRRAASLRPVRRRRARVRRMVGPVVDDALSRTIALAVAMETRGFGGTVGQPDRAAVASTLAGLIGTGVGLYLALTGGGLVGPVLLLGGSAASILGLRRASRTRKVSVYRPEPWRRPEWLVAGLGLLVLVGIITVGRLDPAALHPEGLASPPLAATAVILAASIPAWLAPRHVPRARLQPS